MERRLFEIIRGTSLCFAMYDLVLYSQETIGLSVRDSEIVIKEAACLVEALAKNEGMSTIVLLAKGYRTLDEKVVFTQNPIVVFACSDLMLNNKEIREILNISDKWAGICSGEINTLNIMRVQKALCSKTKKLIQANSNRLNNGYDRTKEDVIREFEEYKKTHHHTDDEYLNEKRLRDTATRKFQLVKSKDNFFKRFILSVINSNNTDFINFTDYHLRSTREESGEKLFVEESKQLQSAANELAQKAHTPILKIETFENNGIFNDVHDNKFVKADDCSSMKKTTKRIRK